MSNATGGIAQKLAQFVCGASIRDLPALDRDIVRRHLSDVVVARIAGAATHEGRAVAALYPATSPINTIAGLAGMVRLTEVDDIHIESCTTPSSVSVPVALGLAAAQVSQDGPGCDPERVLAAVWTGTELIVRLGKAISGASVLYQGVWPTRAGAALGAAAATARMWGLDEKATAHALAFAAMLTNARSGRFAGEPSGRWVLFTEAVAGGIAAAEAARAGFNSDLGALESGWLERSFGVPVDADKLTSGLGTGSVYPELSLKPFCTSRQALSAAEAMRAAIAGGLNPTEIVAVRVKVPAAYAGMISMKLDPAVRGTSYVSAGAQIALAALAPDHLYDVARERVLAQPALQRLAERVVVEADPALDPMFPLRWPAELEIETGSGRIVQRIDEPPGDPGRRLDDDALQAKWAAVLAHTGQTALAPRLMARSHAAMTEASACAEMATLFVAGTSKPDQ